MDLVVRSDFFSGRFNVSVSISSEQKQQFREEGYFLLPGAVPEDSLKVLRDSCDHLIDLMHEEMDRLGTDHIHISHRGKRYHIAKKFEHAPGLSAFVFGDLMAEICKATIGETAYLFYDQYVVKAAEEGMKFSWHQDGGYLGFPHRPYVTVWTAVDEMTLDNGTVHVLPFSTVGIRSLVEHIRDPKTGDKVGYFGRERGVPAVVPAGSIVVMSSLSFHSSGPNTTGKLRRAYVTQYSPEPILHPDTNEPMHLAVPFLENGKNLKLNPSMGIRL